jgi:plasmid stabilization system protein ParE
MPRLIITASARAGLNKCRRFLASKNPEAAKRAAKTIGRHFVLLQSSAEMGRPFANDPALRELLIPFGDAGYAALYVYDPMADEVAILAFRHQKEAGY